jgi:predicted RNA-binding protein with PUA-like domain
MVKNMAYWLMKSEPSEFSIDDLARKQREPWDGVRNFQARNFLKSMQVGDLALMYHSNAKPSGLAGVMKISRPAWPDQTAWEVNHPHYDARSTAEKPLWVQVEVSFVAAFPAILPLATLKNESALADWALVKKGNRLSVLPINASQWLIISDLLKKELGIILPCASA